MFVIRQYRMQNENKYWTVFERYVIALKDPAAAAACNIWWTLSNGSKQRKAKSLGRICSSTECSDWQSILQMLLFGLWSKKSHNHKIVIVCLISRQLAINCIILTSRIQQEIYLHIHIFDVEANYHTNLK